MAPSCQDSRLSVGMCSKSTDIMLQQVHKTIKMQKNIRKGKPKAIIANTKKGFGIPEIENKPLCHIINPKPETIDQILGVT